MLSAGPKGLRVTAVNHVNSPGICHGPTPPRNKEQIFQLSLVDYREIRREDRKYLLTYSPSLSIGYT